MHRYANSNCLYQPKLNNNNLSHSWSSSPPAPLTSQPSKVINYAPYQQQQHSHDTYDNYNTYNGQSNYGYQSTTTKSRLNAILREHGLPGESVFQKKWQWFVTVKTSTELATIPFFSSMRLN
jgi:hypothetical protein